MDVPGSFCLHCNLFSDELLCVLNDDIYNIEGVKPALLKKYAERKESEKSHSFQNYLQYDNRKHIGIIIIIIIISNKNNNNYNENVHVQVIC